MLQFQSVIPVTSDFNLRYKTSYLFSCRNLFEEIKGHKTKDIQKFYRCLFVKHILFVGSVETDPKKESEFSNTTEELNIILSKGPDIIFYSRLGSAFHFSTERVEVRITVLLLNDREIKSNLCPLTKLLKGI